MKSELKGNVQLDFPVICISEKVPIHSANSAKELLVTTNIGFKKGEYENLIVIDQKGHAIYLPNAEKEKNHGLFWGYNILLSKRIQVRLLIEKEWHVELEEFKSIIMKNAFKWRRWLSAGYSNKELTEKINNAKDFLEIIQMF